MDIKEWMRKIVLGKKASSEKYVNYLKNKGVCIGERTTFFSPHQIFVDEQYPWMIKIGNDVQITAGVRILTHDYSWAVLKKVYGDILGAAGKVKIGNNVFIGNGTIILGGTMVGSNVIIGAGSVVKGIIPDNCVAVGNPCKKIMDLDTFYQKRKSRQLSEAADLANAYLEQTGESPPESLFHEFFFLFCKDETMPEQFDNKLKLCGNYEISRGKMLNSDPVFAGFDDFVHNVLRKDR